MKQKSRVPSLAVLWNRSQVVARAPVLLPSLPTQFEFQEQHGMKETETLTFAARTHSSVSPRLLQRHSVAEKLVQGIPATVPMANDVLLRAWVYVEPKSAESYSDVYCLRKSCSHVRATHQT